MSTRFESAMAIHFLDFKAPDDNGIPLLLPNGWPSSLCEFGKLAPLLVSA